MRAECEPRNDGDNVLAVFGDPETSDAPGHAGAVAFSDARILAFPVRSLTGVFAWVTCKAVLDRLKRDLKLVGGDKLPEVPTVEKDEAACAADSPLIADAAGRLMLEEFEFSCLDKGDVRKMASWIAAHAVQDKGTQDRLRTHLAVLHDDAFNHFVRNATEVVARVGLDYERKTVRKGALFYEEYLPAETLFYSLVLCSNSRRPGSQISSASKILQWLRDHAPTTLQIGGGETVVGKACAQSIFARRINMSAS